MENQKQVKSLQLKIPIEHTYLIKEDDETACDQVVVHLISGSAQILGLELKKYYPHTYKMPCVIPIFTWDSCEIKVEWKEEKVGKSSDQWCDLTEHKYIAQSPMIRYLEIHYDLTITRKLALENKRQGPRLALVGGETACLQNIAKTLLNYTGKLNMKPIYVDLDPENSIFIDGTIGATVFQYKSSQELLDKNEKICYFYGNRRIRRETFLKQANILANLTNKKIEKELKQFIEKGSDEQNPSFSSGLILQCPKFNEKEDKKAQRQIIGELMTMFGITHVIIVDNPQISTYLNKYFQKIQKFNTTKLEGSEYFLKSEKKTKISRYLGQQLQTIVLKIDEIILYEFIEPEHDKSFVRLMNIRQELINKTAISIIHAVRDQKCDKIQIADKISNSTIRCIARISKITVDQIHLDINIENFWEECKDKIWVSMISESIS